MTTLVKLPTICCPTRARIRLRNFLLHVPPPPHLQIPSTSCTTLARLMLLDDRQVARLPAPPPKSRCSASAANFCPARRPPQAAKVLAEAPRRAEALLRPEEAPLGPLPEVSPAAHHRAAAIVARPVDRGAPARRHRRRRHPAGPAPDRRQVVRATSRPSRSATCPSRRPPAGPRLLSWPPSMATSHLLPRPRRVRARSLGLLPTQPTRPTRSASPEPARCLRPSTTEPMASCLPS